jgi:hypothetical protein
MAAQRKPPASQASPGARRFTATIELLGINPYVLVPSAQLRALFEAAGRDKGPLPIQVELDGHAFPQHLVRYQGAWRLYLNTPMRTAIGKEVGQRVQVLVRNDPVPRAEPMPAEFARALAGASEARACFDALTPGRKKEILRYLNNLKTAASRARNVETVIAHLRGESRPTLGALLRKKPR